MSRVAAVEFGVVVSRGRIGEQRRRGGGRALNGAPSEAAATSEKWQVDAPISRGVDATPNKTVGSGARPFSPRPMRIAPQP